MSRSILGSGFQSRFGESRFRRLSSVTDNRTQLGVEIDEDLKALVDSDRRSNRDVVEAALWTELSGVDDDGLERRVTELEKRKAVIRKEKERREEELAELESEVQRFRTKLSERQTRQERVLEQAAETLGPEVLGDVNSAIENWAEDAGMEPEEFLERLREMKGY